MLDTRTQLEDWPSPSGAGDTVPARERAAAIRPPRFGLERSLVSLEAEHFEPAVTLLKHVNAAEVDALVSAYGARLVTMDPGRAIPGSYWGKSEAGLIENDVFVRADTPVHSLLHELCHYICMDPARRVQLVTDAGGDDDEECAVCYLQVLLAAELTSFGRTRCLADMDEWGYSFREGSAERWFLGDGASAREWLAERGLIDATGRPTFELRA
jgi:hypothetical protein